ncbi:Hypothetical predicted protein [Pelobates cultripes]|uniref:Uncharacterized protein n=1 Tax=Pelobates cultripes TaxID=61616 RepID=A0AAD1W9T7_PELCU|nr:Hypothetical predicted protein [Pelobates cultripes]
MAVVTHNSSYLSLLAVIQDDAKYGRHGVRVQISQQHHGQIPSSHRSRSAPTRGGASHYTGKGVALKPAGEHPEYYRGRAHRSPARYTASQGSHDVRSQQKAALCISYLPRCSSAVYELPPRPRPKHKMKPQRSATYPNGPGSEC